MNPFLNTAFKAARKAGQMMIRAAGNLDAVKVDSKAFNDFVSDVDRSSEMILVEALKEAYPHHKITCEEGGSHGKATAEYEWIIDPLDGTTNFLHGHPQYAISMALLHKGVLQEALVYAPERNDVYMALPRQRRVAQRPPYPRFQPHRIEPLPDRYRLSCCRSKHDGQVSGDFERFLGKNRRRPS